MHDQLHAPGLVEEALEDNVLLAGHDAQPIPPGGEVAAQLGGRVLVDATSVFDVATSRRLASALQVGVCLSPQCRHALGQLQGAAGGLPNPEGNGGVHALGIGHPHRAGLDPPDPPRVGAEQEHVAGHGLDGEILVHRSHQGVVRIEQDPVVADVGDGTAAGQCGQTGTAPRPEHSVDPVPVHVGHPPSATGRDPVGHQLDHASKSLRARPA